jgi:hypothetical protein
MPERMPERMRGLPVEVALLREGVASLRAAADHFERLRAMPAAQQDTTVLGALERASVHSEAWALAVERIGRRWLLRPIRQDGAGG